jgi:hypothetical protein
MITGPHVDPYDGPGGTDDELRTQTVDPAIETVPAAARLDHHGPLGGLWRYYDPGANIFVERSGFYSELSILNLYGATKVRSEKAATPAVRLWACGTADLWVNGSHITRHSVTRYMQPEMIELAVPLEAGWNQLYVRLQAFGVRDTRMLYGIQILDGAGRLDIAIPDDGRFTAEAVVADGWLNNLRAEGPDRLVAVEPAPARATVDFDDTAFQWPAGEKRVRAASPFRRAEVALRVNNQPLSRTREILENRKLKTAEDQTASSHRTAMIRHVAENGSGDPKDAVKAVMARHALGERGGNDTEIIYDALAWIDGRPDCADFPLAAILRLYSGDTLSHAERRRIKETILGFRYWHDEDGNDAMCFESENHSLFFHSSQMIAGHLFADEEFENSGRSGSEQARIGRARCTAWLEEVEAKGYREFLSSTYLPLTCAALLNIVDFAPTEGLSERAADQVDAIFKLLATQAFDGVTVGPQGRVYRGVLTPDTSGTQAMLSYASPRAVVSQNSWLSFLEASENYQLPDHIERVMEMPVSKRYRQGPAEIHLEKNRDFLLTSVQVPASFQEHIPGAKRADPTGALLPGREGYQQHLWYAGLARDCHVFVNHPGESVDLGHARPGFWYGNGILPRTLQEQDRLMQIFDIPDGHPIPFTHAFWPTRVFDRQEVRDNWSFGTKNDGHIALWCSESLVVCSQVLTDCELRAEGRRTAWVAFCGGRQESSYEDFMDACQSTNPSFDQRDLVLNIDGQPVLEY